MRRRYTQEELDFLEAGYKEMQVPELTAAFNARFNLDKTESQIKVTLTNHKFSCGRKPGNQKGVFKAFTKEQADFVRKNYTQYSLEELTEKLNKEFNTNKTVQQVRSFTRNHRIRSGRTGQYDKGHKPWNAGTKGEGLTGPNSGSFKKGNVPVKLNPIGHERICTKDGFILIKVDEPNPYTGAKTRYRHKHVWLWEQHHGKVPKGKVVAFIDGNKKHCTIENLMLITRAELLHLNRVGYSVTPDEIKPTVLAVAKLEVKTFDKQRKLSNKN